MSTNIFKCNHGRAFRAVRLQASDLDQRFFYQKKFITPVREYLSHLNIEPWKVFVSFASLIRQFATRLTAKEEFKKRKLWKNLKLSAFVVGAAPWLIPDPKCLNKDELTDSEGKQNWNNQNPGRFYLNLSATMSYTLHGENLHFICPWKSAA